MASYVDEFEVKITLKDLNTLKNYADCYNNIRNERDRLEKELEELKGELEKLTAEKKND